MQAVVGFVCRHDPAVWRGEAYLLPRDARGKTGKAKKANVPFCGYFRRKETVEAKRRGHYVQPKPAD